MVYIQILETDIDAFMKFFRAHWPKINISPKMHMLEDHVIPFVRKWRVGLGFYGEQGGESLHHQFKSMRNRYKNIKKPLESLRYMMDQHLKNTNPLAHTIQPKIKNRNLKRKHEE